MEFKLKSLSINELGKRSNQEDSIYPGVSRQTYKGSLFILCDGMGGHSCGEVASATVCETMSKYIDNHHANTDVFDESEFYEALDAAYDALDSKDNDDEKKMGTTLTFVKFHKGGCFVAHIGDSRIYHIRPSEHIILFVTRDHSLINDLVQMGELTPEEAKKSKQKNVITRAMQPHQERRVKADCKNISDIKAGDYFYMCSDGMLEEMEDRELVNILSMDNPDTRKIEILKGATKDNRDNHSAHLIRIESVISKELPQDSSPKELPEQIQAEKTGGENKRKSLVWIFLIAILLGVIAFIIARRCLNAGNGSDKEIIEEVESPHIDKSDEKKEIKPEKRDEPAVVPASARKEKGKTKVTPIVSKTGSAQTGKAKTDGSVNTAINSTEKTDVAKVDNNKDNAEKTDKIEKHNKAEKPENIETGPEDKKD